MMDWRHAAAPVALAFVLAATASPAERQLGEGPPQLATVPVPDDPTPVTKKFHTNIVPDTETIAQLRELLATSNIVSRLFETTA